ncbi:hypothetical protein BT63DRAFT_81336 [Microthyrium microscopicum]|uniref:Uncharacterized protein n=1 Tax=Microthyrium microscopicum TaxID=703497 RepID=A0A6A6TZX3_9PEZI|nr:hypothetical protein BT63DRAFT_81336 [Microthyrium microscopicum]
MGSTCGHKNLLLHPSSHAEAAGYIQPDASKRVAATTTSGRISKAAQKAESVPLSSVFPAPLVLPGDSLDYDPKEPGQTVRAWVQMKTRNEVTSRRKTIYVVAPPSSNDSTLSRQLEKWTQPKTGKEGTLKVNGPSTQHIVEYLQAFYSGMSVKRLDNFFEFTTWDDKPSSKADAPDFMGLIVKNEVVRIRTRSCPDNMFERQLNLNDLLDACITALPADAFSMVLLTDQDLYEDEEDDFCCGRAYGGSRVSVVSSARYHPLLDQRQSVERLHAWPASHCADYVKACCSEATGKKASKKRRIDPSQMAKELDVDSAMQAAVLAYKSGPSLLSAPSQETLTGLWLGRVCRTVSHELGHCFGIGHCPYYACAMQGTASIAEDARQPPYLCPVDLIKVLRATGAKEVDRYHALLSFCKQHQDVHLFGAFRAWIEVVLKTS